MKRKEKYRREKKNTEAKHSKKKNMGGEKKRKS
jgi:hypothetical protein